MKKISAIVLAIVLVMMASVPFCASADTTFTVTAGDIAPATETVTVTIGYETADAILNGKMYVNFDAEKMELVVEDPDMVDDLVLIKGVSGAVNVEKAAEGEIQLGFTKSTKIAASGEVIALTFKLLDGAPVGAEYVINLKVTEWATQDADLAKDNAIETAAKLVVAAPATTTEAPATTTTEAPATTTTKKASTTGEATPWALLATVTVAGAALVVLSTKKSK